MIFFYSVLTRTVCSELNVEAIARERFGRAVALGVTDFKLKNATSSPINGLLENIFPYVLQC